MERDMLWSIGYKLRLHHESFKSPKIMNCYKNNPVPAQIIISADVQTLQPIYSGSQHLSAWKRTPYNLPDYIRLPELEQLVFYQCLREKWNH
jgi:hypothetical protein